jgi:long-chain acyl-CoA synthetase
MHMALDVELYRRTVYVPVGHGAKRSLRRLSVIDIQPEGASRTLVFVHGYGGSALQWLYQLRFFGQTMRVVAPDLRGHGHSDDPASVVLNMEGLVDDLETVLGALQVPRPFVLIAHSFGGAVATEYALRHPEQVSELVLIGVPSRFMLRPILRELMQIPDPLFSGIAKRIRVALFASQQTLVRMHDRVMALWRGDERLQLLRVPTLVVLGQRDTVFTRQRYEDVPRSIPGAYNVVIPVSAHLVQLERPDAVNRAIRRFILPKQQQKGAVSFLSNVHPGDHTHEASSGMVEARQTAPVRLADMPWLQYYDRDVPELLPLPTQLLHEMLSTAAQDFPHRTALHFFGQQISYRELDSLSNRFAHALQKLGIHKGDRVAVVLPNIPQCVIAFYGTLKAGGVLVLGSPLSNEEEIAYQIRDSGAHVLLTLTSYRDRIARICAGSEIQQVIYTDVREYLPFRQRMLLASLIDGSAPHAQTSFSLENSNGAASDGTVSTPNAAASSLSWRSHSFQQLLRSQPTTLLESGTASEDLALLQYTSGTTDSPKGVMLTHGNLMVNVAQVRHWMPDARHGREVVLSVLPLSHSYGVTDCLNLPVALAASIVLLPTTRIDELLKAIKRYHPSIFPGIPSLYLAIANYPHVRSYGVGSIRICVSGSAPLPVEVQEAFEKLTRGRLVEGYGLTEASPVTHANPLQGERRVGSIGIPLPDTNARVVDWKTGAPLPSGEVGELLIRGPQVMQGYWNMPDETTQALKDGWLHTGDLAVMDEDGFFSIIERKKDIILSGPYNVYPRDVEEVLYEHPKVLEAAVVSTPIHGGNGTEGAASSATQSPFIKAVVVLKRGEKATADELLALCRERLDAYKVPKQIEFRSELPKNLVGKVLRRLLVET